MVMRSAVFSVPVKCIQSIGTLARFQCAQENSRETNIPILLYENDHNLIKVVLKEN